MTERNYKMKKILALLMCIISVVVSLCACTNPDEFSDSETLSKDYTRNTDPSVSYNYDDGATSAPLSYTVYASSMTNFELRLFRNYFAQQQDKTKSTLLAPIGTVLQLSLLANGATGDSSDELSLALGSDLTLDDINVCSSYFKSRMEAVSKIGNGEVDELSGKKTEAGETEFVHLGTDVFFNDTLDVKTGFLQTNASYFGGDIFRFMFSDKDALSKVNSSLSDFTDSQAFTSLDKDSSMFMVSSSDVSDLWLESYSKADIEQGTFKSSSSDKSVNFMTSNETLIKSDKAQGVIKYTSKNPLKLMLIMPDEDISLEEYISDFDYTEFSNLLNSVDITKKATAQIPEFTVSNGSQAVPLSEPLSDSGLYTLFTDEISFKNISNSDDLRIDEIYELTDEISISASGINSDSEIAQNRADELEKTDSQIKFDRPFMFLLIDNESSIPLYIGTVDNI